MPHRRSLSPERSLFSSGEDAPRDPDLEAERARVAPLAARLPARVRFGTSSWSYPGWRGIVFPSFLPNNALTHEGLAHYCRYPLFRTVCFDRGFYQAMSREALTAYLPMLPAGFECCIKAPSSVMTYWSDGRVNEGFLSAERLTEEMLAPLRDVFMSHMGVVILEIPPVPAFARLSAFEFTSRLDRFLSELPRGFRYGVELRDAGYFTPRYVRALERRGASHVYNLHPRMQPLERQVEAVPPEGSAFTVVRLLQAGDEPLEQRKKRLAPFKEASEPDDAMRDTVARVVNASVGACFVIATNRAEGSSPRTIEAIAQRVAT